MKPNVLLFSTLLLITLLFNLFVFPYFSAKTGGLQPLDTRFFYNPRSAADLLAMLGENGRKWYFLMAGLADMIYPLAYGGVFVMLARWVSRRRLLHLTAFSAPAVDFAENLATISMLLRYPAFDKPIALAGSFFNGIKWIAVTAFLLTLTAIVARKLVGKINERSG